MKNKPFGIFFFFHSIFLILKNLFTHITVRIRKKKNNNTTQKENPRPSLCVCRFPFFSLFFSFYELNAYAVRTAEVIPRFGYRDDIARDRGLTRPHGTSRRLTTDRFALLILNYIPIKIEPLRASCDHYSIRR